MANDPQHISRNASDPAPRRVPIPTAVVFWVIIIVAIMFRIPGLFWGLSFTGAPSYLRYHPDELNLAAYAKEFWRGESNEKLAYPKGYPFQLALASRLIGARHEDDALRIVFAGRLLSLAYGVGAVALVFALAFVATNNITAALCSALLFALCGAHVTQSHFATADTASVFWILGTMLCSWRFAESNRMTYLIAASLCCGMALAVKFAVIACIPVIASIMLSRRRIASLAWSLVLALLSFFLASGGHFSAQNLLFIAKNVLNDNLQATASHNDWLNPLVYLCEVVPGMGLVSFLLCGLGVALLCPKFTTYSLRQILSQRSTTIIAIPVVAQFLAVCFLDVPFVRHILLLFPVLCIPAGIGMSNLMKHAAVQQSLARKAAVLSLIVLYQALYVAAVEYYFVFDTREMARRWATENIPTDATIMPSRYVDPIAWSDAYSLTSTTDADYLILHETYYFRFLRSILSPQARFPDENQLFHGSAKELAFVRSLFTHDDEHRFLRSFPVKALTPEILAFKKIFGTFTLYLGDVLVYERRP